MQERCEELVTERRLPRCGDDDGDPDDLAFQSAGEYVRLQLSATPLSSLLDGMGSELRLATAGKDNRRSQSHPCHLLREKAGAAVSPGGVCLAREQVSKTSVSFRLTSVVTRTVVVARVAFIRCTTEEANEQARSARVLPRAPDQRIGTPKLAPAQKRTFWACFGGWALDAYDVQIFSFAIPAQPWPRLTTILAARRRSAAAKSL